NYNIDGNHNVFINGGYFSRQPIFDNVFINFRNDVNPDAGNQRVSAIEVGYGYRSQYFSANVNLYNTQWGNRQISQSLRREIDINVTPTQTDGNVNFTDVDRKSTRLNSSHVKISYAVFCLKKKKRRENADC